jgi:hypothetical protein
VKSEGLKHLGQTMRAPPLESGQKTRGEAQARMRRCVLASERTLRPRVLAVGETAMANVGNFKMRHEPANRRAQQTRPAF